MCAYIHTCWCLGDCKEPWHWHKSGAEVPLWIRGNPPHQNNCCRRFNSYYYIQVMRSVLQCLAGIYLVSRAHSQFWSSSCLAWMIGLSSFFVIRLTECRSWGRTATWWLTPQTLFSWGTWPAASSARYSGYIARFVLNTVVLPVCKSNRCVVTGPSKQWAGLLLLVSILLHANKQLQLCYIHRCTSFLDKIHILLATGGMARLRRKRKVLLWKWECKFLRFVHNIPIKRMYQRVGRLCM